VNSRIANSTIARNRRLERSGGLPLASGTLGRAMVSPHPVVHHVIVTKRDCDSRATSLAWLARHVIEHPGNAPEDVVTDMCLLRAAQPAGTVMPRLNPGCGRRQPQSVTSPPPWLCYCILGT
jgi:hypothetical protein